MAVIHETSKVPPILVHHRLRIAREYAGHEQEELARLMGVSRNTVSNAENGKRAPRQITLKMWALVCGVSPDWIANGPPIPTAGPLSSPGAASSRRIGRQRRTDDNVGKLPRVDSNHQPSGWRFSRGKITGMAS